MNIEMLGAFLGALNTIMLIRILFNDLHQIREQLNQLEHDFIAHLTKEEAHG